MYKGSIIHLCLAAVKSKIAPETLATETINKFLKVAGHTRIPLKVLGVYDDSQSLSIALSKSGCRGLILLVGSGGTEQLIIDVVEKSSLHTLLVAIESYNSLAAMLEAYAYLRQTGRRWIHNVFLDLAKNKGDLSEALKPLYAVIDIKHSRIGIIGEPAPWLVYNRVSPADVKKIFGSEIIEIPLNRLDEYLEGALVSSNEIMGLQAIASPRIMPKDLEKALKVYYALKSMADSYGLRAFTINCFKLIERVDVTPCYAVARLNSEGIIAGCEGDVPSLLTMMLMSRLSEHPAMMGNIVSLREREVILAHCTAPLRLASSYVLETHMETGKGVGVAASLPKGRQVTLGKIDMRRERIVAFTGRIVDSGMLSPRQCRTQVVVKTSSDVLRLLDDPVGSHLVLTLGNIMRDLKIASRLIGFDFQRLPSTA